FRRSFLPPSPPAKQAAARKDSGQITRDSPHESQTGINVRVFPPLLQDRREVLTATSTSGNPNAWSRERPWLTTFAPILISFSVKLVSDQSLIGSGVASVRRKLPRL